MRPLDRAERAAMAEARRLALLRALWREYGRDGERLPD